MRSCLKIVFCSILIGYTIGRNLIVAVGLDAGMCDVLWLSFSGVEMRDLYLFDSCISQGVWPYLLSNMVWYIWDS